jgi:hypothetical protein
MFFPCRPYYSPLSPRSLWFQIFSPVDIIHWYNYTADFSIFQCFNIFRPKNFGSKNPKELPTRINTKSSFAVSPWEPRSGKGTNLESESYYYEECAEMLAERTGILKKELISLGIENENPKPFILTSTPSSIGLTEGVSSGDTRLPTS